jgi:beta-galactosidase
MRVALASVFLLAACGGDDAAVTAGSDAASADVSSDTQGGESGALTFDEDFLLGTAIAGFQVDMGCPTLAPEACEDRNSDWYDFITAEETVNSAGAYIHGDPPSSGPGYWELFDTDHQLASEELGSNALRLSIEWSRIFPEATDDAEGFEALSAIADQEAIAHYHAIFDSLANHGLTPLVTLNHYTLPSWIHDAVGCHQNLADCSPRGWVDKDRTVTEIAKYAGFVAQEFGAKIDRWVTLNEPFAVLMPGYLLPSEERSNPPAQLMAFEEGKTVFVGLIEAHARMYDAVHEADVVDADGDGEVAQVGVVYSMVPVAPQDPDNELDVAAAENVFYLYNLAYMNAVCAGDLDHDLDGVSEYREDLANRMDYVGINYYTRIKVEGTQAPTLAALSPLSTFNPLNIALWEQYPRGLYEMVMEVRDRWNLPSIITENGVPDATNPETTRENLVRALSWVHRAQTDGAEVGGYFYWTLIDNYEWNHGMSLPFGLYAVDPLDETKARVARPFAAVFSDIAKARGVSEELQAEFPIQ